MRVALVSREFFPLAPGGLAAYVTALADLLADSAEVTILTSAGLESRYQELLQAGDPSLPDDRVRIEFVSEPEPEEVADYLGHVHAYGARVFERLCDLYPDGGPDLVEIPDYLGEGAVVVQARRVRDSALDATTVAVRAYTTAEMCSVLNGSISEDFTSQSIFALERYSLRHADYLVWPGGDVLGAYHRFFGSMPLAPGVEIAHPLDARSGTQPSSAPPPSQEGELRILYMGRLERRKGVQSLLQGLTAIPGNWRLTMVGGDTDTAPLGLSMRGQLELMAGRDPRVAFLDHVERSALPSLIAAHDIVAVPSRWECWPNVALEALRENRPVAVTPVGGLLEMVGAPAGERVGEAGWVARDTTSEGIAELFEDLLGDRGRIEEAIRGGGARRRFEALTDADAIRAGYERLADGRSNRGTPNCRACSPPLVSIVVPYFQLEQYVEEAVDSAFAQTYASVEVIVVNDGATRDQDQVLAGLATRYPIRVVLQSNTGLGAARNLGILQSVGRYVLPLDADNILEPEFVERAVEVLEHDERVAYVTSWSRYIDGLGQPLADRKIGYQPLGNEAPLVHFHNVAGDAMALLRRRLFDMGFSYSTELTSYEDWFLYRELAEAGWNGLVIPRRLLRYRVRDDSMVREIGFPKRERLEQEMRAHLREREVRWVS